jgi:antitoxin HicB
MKTAVEKGRVGGTFEDFLKEQGVLEESNAAAIKRVAAWQAKQRTTDQKISKSAPSSKSASKLKR